MDFNFLSDPEYDILGAFWMTIAADLLVGDRLAHPRASILAAMRVSPVPLMRGFATGYVNIFRNIPLTV